MEGLGISNVTVHDHNYGRWQPQLGIMKDNVCDKKPSPGFYKEGREGSGGCEGKQCGPCGTFRIGPGGEGGGLFATPWTVACQAPLSMGFPRQEYWSGLPCPPPGDLPEQGIKPSSLMFPTLAGRFFTTSATWEASPTHTFFFFHMAEHNWNLSISFHSETFTQIP